MKNIIILAKRQSSPARKIATECSKLGRNVVILDPRRITYFTNEKDRFYYSVDAKYSPISIMVNSISCIVNYCANSKVSALENVYNIPVVNSIKAVNLASNKHKTALKLSQHNLPTAEESLITSTRVNIPFIANRLQFPQVLKTQRGSQGKTVWIANNLEESNEKITSLLEENKPVIVQSFVHTSNAESKPKDYRVIIVDGKYIACMERVATSGIKTNLTIHNNGSKHDASEEMIYIAKKATKVIGLSICGVDLAYDIAKQSWVCYEVNAAPGMKICAVTNINVAQHIAKYSIEFGRVVKENLPPQLPRFKPSHFKKSKEELSEIGEDDTIKLLANPKKPFMGLFTKVKNFIRIKPDEVKMQDLSEADKQHVRNGIEYYDTYNVDLPEYLQKFSKSASDPVTPTPSSTPKIFGYEGEVILTIPANAETWEVQKIQREQRDANYLRYLNLRGGDPDRIQRELKREEANRLRAKYGFKN